MPVFRVIELVLEGDLISEDIEMLKKQLEAKDEKLKNQANELNHLTNTVVPTDGFVDNVYRRLNPLFKVD